MAWAAGTTSFLIYFCSLMGSLGWCQPPRPVQDHPHIPLWRGEYNLSKIQHRRFQRAPGARDCVDKAWETSQRCHLLWGGAGPAAVPVLCWEATPALCPQPGKALPACSAALNTHSRESSPLLLCLRSAESFDLSKPAEMQNISVIVHRRPSSDREQSPT